MVFQLVLARNDGVLDTVEYKKSSAYTLTFFLTFIYQDTNTHSILGPSTLH